MRLEADLVTDLIFVDALSFELVVDSFGVVLLDSEDVLNGSFMIG
jgi:hypothetical protein